MTARLAYSLSEAAQQASLSVRSLRYLMATGKLGYVRVGRRILIPHAELERLLRRGLVKATEPLDADESIRPRTQKGLGRHPEAQTAESPRPGGKPGETAL
jgi:excisionase family DNA binding protein